MSVLAVIFNLEFVRSYLQMFEYETIDFSGYILESSWTGLNRASSSLFPVLPSAGHQCRMPVILCPSSP